MAYWADIYRFPNSIEYEYKFAGNYGAKGEKRAKKQKATPERIKKQNQINKVNYYRRLIKANFFSNDCWVCLKYPKGTRKSVEEVKKDIAKFNRRMRADFDKRCEDYKWIRRIEIGKRGGIHVHMIINRICGIDLLISKNWPGNRYHVSPMYEQGDFRQLASYICKPVPEELEQLSFIDMDEVKQTASISTSKNLVRPKPERKAYVRRTMKQIIQNGPKAHDGFYIDKESIRIGINQCTGYSYVHYTEVRIKQIKREIRAPGENEKLHRRNGKGAT